MVKLCEDGKIHRINGEIGMLYKDIDLRNDEVYLQLYELFQGDTEKGSPPAYRFYIKKIDDETTVGKCSFRIGNSGDIMYGGNIGYDIDEPYRGNKYSLKACTLLFQLAQMHHMETVLITCRPENKASRRICELLGAKLEGIVDLPEDDYNYQRGARVHCIYKVNTYSSFK